MNYYTPKKPFDVLLDNVIDTDLQIWQEEKDREPTVQIEFEEDECH